MKLRSALVNLSVLAASVGIGLLVCEFGARLILNPADYLSVEMVPDKVLGAVPSPRARANGFDEWGFRNPKVPATAEIVAIGDSHTYGNTATMEDSWPYVLGRLTGKTVYNMGMGGYGPNQYLHLLKTRALSLKPKIIVCGLYMGDDFENAFLITYGLDHWAYFREYRTAGVDSNIWQQDHTDQTWHKGARIWLSRNSVLYQLVVHGALLAPLKGKIQNARQVNESATSLIIPEERIAEVFLPKSMLSRLDQESPAVLDGMRITLKLLDEMYEICREKNIQFLVAIIPTKEMVFSRYLENNPKIHLSAAIVKLIANERLAREKVFRFLVASGIPYVDTLPFLKRVVDQSLYVKSAKDMHPNRNGYRVIAEAVFEALTKASAKD